MKDRYIFSGVFGLFAALIVGCYFYYHYVFIDKFNRDLYAHAQNTSGAPIKLAELTDFEWDEVCVKSLAIDADLELIVSHHIGKCAGKTVNECTKRFPHLTEAQKLYFWLGTKAKSVDELRLLNLNHTEKKYIIDANEYAVRGAVELAFISAKSKIIYLRYIHTLHEISEHKCFTQNASIQIQNNRLTVF